MRILVNYKPWRIFIRIPINKVIVLHDFQLTRSNNRASIKLYFTCIVSNINPIQVANLKTPTQQPPMSHTNNANNTNNTDYQAFKSHGLALSSAHSYKGEAGAEHADDSEIISRATICEISTDDLASTLFPQT